MPWDGPVSVACTLFDGARAGMPAFSANIYSPEWVNKFFRGIKRNTTRDVRCVCITDFTSGFDPGIELVKPILNRKDYWALMEPYRPDLELGRAFAFGIDTVFIGSLDEIFGYDGDFAMHSVRAELSGEWSKHKHRWAFGNGVVGYTTDTGAHLWERFAADPDHYDRVCRFPGFTMGAEQIFLNEYNENKIDDLNELYPWQIVSFVRDMKRDEKKFGDKPRILFFHGNSKPQNFLGNPLIAENWI